ncbi:ABC transporter permease [Nocardiopsis sediminis]|uniref:ABC transporter permease n=1 Tax=Nocardiopsis sediminis TaxID=1778267 RepID=A0ABV8FSN5_9ACTN
MTLLHAVAAELRKAATLPATLVAIAVAALGSLAITLLNSVNVRAAIDSGRLDTVAYTSPVEAVFAAVPMGTVGAVILGVVVISSEYTANSPDAGGGRQITATLTATPRRLTLLAAKACTAVLLVLATAAVALPACLAVAQSVIGEAGASDGLGDVVARSAGAALYWALTALMALAVTVLTRSGIVPLIVLIANSSLVSVSFLLTRLTDLAYALPDLAGMGLFAGDTRAGADGALDPLTGGVAMAAWAFGLLAVSALVLTRRDA